MTTKEYFKKEKDSQNLINRFYKSQGWSYDRSGACITYDLIIEGVKIEEKFRYEDYGDFLIEIIQDVNSCNLGWYYKTEAARIFYVIKDQVIYSVNWADFKAWLTKEYKALKLRGIVSIDGYGLTVNISIKWIDVPDYIYKKFELDTAQLSLY